MTCEPQNVELESVEVRVIAMNLAEFVGLDESNSSSDSVLLD